MANLNLKQDLLEMLKPLPEEASMTEIRDTINSFYKKHPNELNQKTWHSNTGRYVFALSILFAIFSLLVVSKIVLKHVPYADYVAYAFWVIAPPCWFLLEYVWIFPDDMKFDSDQFSDLKYVHELAGKIWAGLVVIMSLMLLLNTPGHDLSKSIPTSQQQSSPRCP